MAERGRFDVRAHLRDHAHPASRRGPILAQGLMVLAAMAVGIAGSLALQSSGLSSRLLQFDLSGQAATPYHQRDFPLCGGHRRVTCVVDGDTFWLDGVKIRIADIDTPEIGEPQCAAEARLGQRATLRLQQVLSAGPFALAPADRDTDRYGRKLRIVLRGGQSLGATLVDEGLAHDWGGSRRGWC